MVSFVLLVASPQKKESSSPSLSLLLLLQDEQLGLYASVRLTEPSLDRDEPSEEVVTFLSHLQVSQISIQAHFPTKRKLTSLLLSFLRSPSNQPTSLLSLLRHQPKLNKDQPTLSHPPQVSYLPLLQPRSPRLASQRAHPQPRPVLHHQLATSLLRPRTLPLLRARPRRGGTLELRECRFGVRLGGTRPRRGRKSF